MAPDRLHLLSKDFCLLLFTLFCAVENCTGFNLDTRFPVIKQGPTEGSFFGLSVALHKQTKGANRYLLLTGAPKEKAQSSLKVNETGAVYSCPVTISPSDCNRMDLVNSVTSSEIVEGMWLGVAVASQRELPEGRVLACGHRFIKVINPGPNEVWRMIGKCYVRGNDLTFDFNDDWQSYPYEDCNPSGNFEGEGMCTMGISAGISPSDVYAGSPGSYVWQGNVHATRRPLDPAQAWDFNYKAFKNLEKSFSYMGYSVAEEKKLLSLDEYTLVTGSPRDNTRGSVTLAKLEYSLLQTMVIIYGEQVGSYFGNSITVTDLNSDGWNDLIVGAPFYFDRKKEKGGAVYVYMNENGSFKNVSTLTLFGFKDSAFGMSVAAIGDINQDGFQDFAVGAPFHGSGKVFIWMGSQRGVTEEPSQVIEGKEVGDGAFRTFGYSINGGMDMDENNYPDVLVGSLDNRIALLRSRPVLHLNETFIVEPGIVDPSQCTSDSCVTVRVCFSYMLSNGDKNLKKNINVRYTVEADSGRRSSRLRFLDNRQDSYTGSYSMPSGKCQVLKLSVVEPLRDRVHPVIFSLNVSLHEENPDARQTLQNLDSFPILARSETTTEKVEIHFQKECGMDNKCESNLQMAATFANEHLDPYPSSQGGYQVMQFNSTVKKLTLMLNVTNLPAPGRLAEDAHEAMLNMTVPPSLSYSGVRPSGIKCTMEGTLLCELGNPFKSNTEDKIQILFETSGITLYTREIQSVLQLSTLSEQKDLKPIPIVLKVEYTLQTSFSVDPHVQQTEFSGTVVGESAMNSTDDIGSPVEYAFKVDVLGERLGTMGTLEVELTWPFEVANGKWLLYLTEILTKGTSESHCNPPGPVVNPLGLVISDPKPRRKREVDPPKPEEPELQASITLQKPRARNVYLSCDQGTARCVTFACPLRNMNHSAELIVRARVWNSTMLEDYVNDRVIVRGKATLKLATDKPAIKMTSETREFVLNIDPGLRETHLYQVPLWIIIVSVLAGVLLLGMIILLLWKCGFFRRASRRELYEAKAQKAEMKIQPSENERLAEEC
ncbi:integrin alpha-3-like isoform X1 [Megalops cyprinoides]|uniref:integrin alpha-3-like isoform X1 n=1 Tax=Megalops cyprinoides TaxID=118141 RepID=UPI001864A98B|nr:integrin alpha-3-like isoform X1 [Megalops cyprinoides]